MAKKSEKRQIAKGMSEQGEVISEGKVPLSGDAVMLITILGGSHTSLLFALVYLASLSA